MSHLSTSTATLSPDRSRVSTLGSIWTSRHKAKPAPLTNAEAARRRMDMEALAEADFGADAYREPAGFLYLIVAYALGVLGCGILYSLLFHGSDVLRVLDGALTGGR